MRFSTYITLIVTFACTACNSGSSTVLEIQSNGIESFATVSTPTQLRNVPIEDLYLFANINGNEQFYDQNHNINGEWDVQFTTIENASNTVIIQWYVQDHLIIEESGQFMSSSFNTVTRLDLEYTSAGQARFDSDCDGFSNLEEITSTTDINEFFATEKNICEDNNPDIELNDTEFPWIIRRHKDFEQDGVTERVTDYRQEMQIDSITADGTVAFYTELHSALYELPTGESASHFAALGFEKSEARPKSVIVILNASIDAMPDRIDGACNPNAPENIGFKCTLPFDWQEGSVYTFRLQENSENEWRASVVDNATEDYTGIATFITDTNIDWEFGRNVLSTDHMLTSAECRTGLEQTVRTKYRAPIVNFSHTLDTQLIKLSNCVQAGVGWSEGIKIVGNGPEYSLNLGVPE